MPSMTTLFRAVVMIVVGAVIVKGWQMYGPPNEKVKAFGVQAMERVQSMLNGPEKPAASATPNPSGGAPQFAGGNPVLPASTAPPAAALLTPSEAPRLLPEGAAKDAIPIAQAPIAPLPNEASPSAATGGQMPQLMSRLEQLGAAETKLAPWGDGGQLYRFSCRAPLDSSSALSRHFEAVAAEPQAAVEQVLAKVEAWRTAQSKERLLR